MSAGATSNDTLASAIERYQSARKHFREAVDSGMDDETVDKVWETVDAADLAVLRFPCRTPEDIEVKVRFYLTDEYAFDTAQNGIIGETDALTVFLQSLVPLVDNGDNGDKS